MTEMLGSRPSERNARRGLVPGDRASMRHSRSPSPAAFPRRRAAVGRPAMLARDVMTTDPATIALNAPLHAVAATMVEGGVTGLPVVDTARKLLGLVTESDLLHRLAAAEQKQHGYLWGAFHSVSRQAGDYARSHGRFAADVMTPAEDLVTATEDTTAEHLAKVMEERRIRHVPIVQAGSSLVGLVTRAHLLRAALQLPEHRDAHAPDNAI